MSYNPIIAQHILADYPNKGIDIIKVEKGYTAAVFFTTKPQGSTLLILGTGKVHATQQEALDAIVARLTPELEQKLIAKRQSFNKGKKVGA